MVVCVEKHAPGSTANLQHDEVFVSTVLWAHVLVDGKVVSEQADFLALYKHAQKLDAIAKELKLQSFLDICDTTDQRFNIDDIDLPPGMTSTTEVMAEEGAWMPAGDAAAYLEALRDHIVAKNVRFGLLSNQQAQVIVELEEVIGFVKSQAHVAEKFNFSVVM